MTVGFVVIEYNQASKWPSLESDTLFDSENEAQGWADHARADTAEIGRLETYAVARVELVDTASERCADLESSLRDLVAAIERRTYHGGDVHGPHVSIGSIMSELAEARHSLAAGR